MNEGSGKDSSLQVQVRNIRLGVATFWSLEKFEYKLAAMKELYEVCLGLFKKKKNTCLLNVCIGTQNFACMNLKLFWGDNLFSLVLHAIQKYILSQPTCVPLPACVKVSFAHCTNLRCDLFMTLSSFCVM